MIYKTLYNGAVISLLILTYPTFKANQPSENEQLVFMAVSQKIYISFFIPVPDLPSTHTDNFWQAEAVSSVSDDGVYVQFKNYFYELICDSSSCAWTIMSNELDDGSFANVLTYLPQDFTCPN